MSLDQIIGFLVMEELNFSTPGDALLELVSCRPQEENCIEAVEVNNAQYQKIFK